MLALSLALGAACSSAGGSGGSELEVIPRDNTPPVIGGGNDNDMLPPGAPSSGGGGDLLAGGGDSDGPAPGCQQAARSFTPTIPTVFVMVDRSGTMFQPLNLPGNPSASAWSVLREGVLQVMQELQDNVRFGFGAFSGIEGCSEPNMPMVAPALNNLTSIDTAYPLGRPTDPNDDETPALLALDRAARALWDDPVEGDKFILYVTDGEPDYCDSGTPVCPPDSVVGRLQRLSAGAEVDELGNPRQPIRTIVFGITAPGTSIQPGTLQAFANAGAGEPVAPFTADPNSIWDPCNVNPGWAAEFERTGKPLMRGQTTGNYSPVGGTTPFYSPDATNQALLVEQLRSALAETKSCTFDLSDDGVEVDVARPDLGEKAVVNVNGNRIPLDPVNGWHMVTPTTVQLEGAACDAWRVFGETTIDFDFPCDIIVLR